LFDLLLENHFLSLAIFFVFGSLLGSFANVIIVRLPKNESVVKPRSFCRSCSKTIKWQHNIPIFSWIFLGGKCAYCKAPYSVRYPLTELLMGVAFALTFQAVGYSFTLIEYLYFVFALITCAFIDLDHMILPDKFTLSGIVIGLVGALINPEREFLQSLFGVLMGGGFLWAVAYLYYAFRGREGMGGGDIKLLAWIGAMLGWQSIPMIILLSSVVGSLVGITMAIRTKDGMKYAIPFGPFLVAATLFYIFVHGDRIGEWYLSLHGFGQT
jgi:leader peptidase (prepilin peptidase) / N-methyltransferase